MTVPTQPLDTNWFYILTGGEIDVKIYCRQSKPVIDGRALGISPSFRRDSLREEILLALHCLQLF